MDQFFKSHHVKRGYTKREYINYETFSLVIRFFSLCLMLENVASLNLELSQVGAKTTLLNEELDKEVYIEQPTSFEVKGNEQKVSFQNVSYMVLNNRLGNGT